MSSAMHWQSQGRDEYEPEGKKEILILEKSSMGSE